MTKKKLYICPFAIAGCISVTHCHHAAPHEREADCTKMLCGVRKEKIKCISTTEWLTLDEFKKELDVRNHKGSGFSHPTTSESKEEKNSGQSSGKVPNGLPSQNSTSRIIPCVIIAEIRLKYPITITDTHTLTSLGTSTRRIVDLPVTCAMKADIPIGSSVPSAEVLLQNPLVKSAFTVFQKMLVQGYEMEIKRLNPPATSHKESGGKISTANFTPKKKSISKQENGRL